MAGLDEAWLVMALQHANSHDQVLKWPITFINILDVYDNTYDSSKMAINFYKYTVLYTYCNFHNNLHKYGN